MCDVSALLPESSFREACASTSTVLPLLPFSVAAESSAVFGGGALEPFTVEGSFVLLDFEQAIPGRAAMHALAPRTACVTSASRRSDACLACMCAAAAGSSTLVVDSHACDTSLLHRGPMHEVYSAEKASRISRTEDSVHGASAAGCSTQRSAPKQWVRAASQPA